MQRSIVDCSRVALWSVPRGACYSLLGFFFPRPELPPVVSKQVCQQNNIYFDTSSIERIYNDPESTLADPQAFLSQDPAYALLAESRARGADPFQYESFVSAYNSIADENMGLRYGGKP